MTTQLHAVKAQALAAQAKAATAEADRYQAADDTRAGHAVATIGYEAGVRSKFLADINRLESDMAVLHNRAVQQDSFVRCNPASPERTRTAVRAHHLSY